MIRCFFVYKCIRSLNTQDYFWALQTRFDECVMLYRVGVLCRRSGRGCWVYVGRTDTEPLHGIQYHGSFRVSNNIILYRCSGSICKVYKYMLGGQTLNLFTEFNIMHARIQRGGGDRGSRPPWDLSEVGSCVDVWWVGEGVQGLFLSYYYNFFLASFARHYYTQSKCLEYLSVITSKFQVPSLKSSYTRSLTFIKVHFNVYFV